MADYRSDREHTREHSNSRHEAKKREAVDRARLAAPSPAPGADAVAPTADHASPLPAPQQADQAQRLSQALAAFKALREENDQLRSERAPLLLERDRLREELEALRQQVGKTIFSARNARVAATFAADHAFIMVRGALRGLLPKLAEVVAEDRGAIPLLRMQLECKRAGAPDLPTKGRAEVLQDYMRARRAGLKVVAVAMQLRVGNVDQDAFVRLVHLAGEDLEAAKLARLPPPDRAALRAAGQLGVADRSGTQPRDQVTLARWLMDKGHLDHRIERDGELMELINACEGAYLDAFEGADPPP